MLRKKYYKVFAEIIKTNRENNGTIDNIIVSLESTKNFHSVYIIFQLQ